jgi:hypothetical protein
MAIVIAHDSDELEDNKQHEDCPQLATCNALRAFRAQLEWRGCCTCYDHGLIDCDLCIPLLLL